MRAATCVMLADNCFCAALLLGLTAYDLDCLTSVVPGLHGNQAEQHIQIRKILRKAVASAMTGDIDDDMEASLQRMISSLSDGMTVWDDVCSLVCEMVGMKINVLTAVDTVEVLQVAHYSPGVGW